MKLAKTAGRVAILAFSPEDQVRFAERVKKEIFLILEEKENRWEGKPKMIAPYLIKDEPFFVLYQRPALRDKQVASSLGMAAWIIEEQVSHHGHDPKMRYEVYVLRHKWLASRLCHTDESFILKEGSCIIGIKDISKNKVVITTRHGEKEMTI